MAKPSVSATIGVVDTKEFFRKLGKLTRAVEARVVEGLQDHADEIFRQSQAQVPVLTGVLRASAIPPVAKKEIGSDSFSAEIRYTRDYALEVHEKTFVKHKTGKAKYLSDPISNEAPKMLDRIGAKVRKAL